MVEKETQFLNELFAPPSSESNVAVIVDGQKMYTSKELKIKFIKALMKNTKGKKVAKSFMNLVKNNKVIPCWYDKGLLSFLKRKIHDKIYEPDRGSIERGNFAFYSPTADVIIIFLQESSVFGYINNHWLTKLTIHEVLHMVSKKLGNRFLSLFKDELDTYYTELFTSIFYLDKNSKVKDEVRNIYSFIHKKIELPIKASGSTFVDYRGMILERLKPHSNLADDIFYERVSAFFNVIKFFLRDEQLYINNMKNYRDIVNPLYMSYKKIAESPKTMCIQELLAPSEVIGIMSEFVDSSKVIKAIKMLEI